MGWLLSMGCNPTLGGAGFPGMAMASAVRGSRMNTDTADFAPNRIVTDVQFSLNHYNTTMKNRVPQPVLVTGASGFIGRHLVRRLVGLGDRVSCLVRAASCVDELRSAGAQWVTGDVTDRASMRRALAVSQAGIVFHLAGLTKALRLDDFLRVNAGGVEAVAAACADRTDKPVLVVVSSLAAAGPCAGGQPRVESDAATPVSAYGCSKLAGEQAAAMFAGVVPISIVRPPIVFGPGDRGMLEMFRPIARWGIHAVPGRGERCFSLIHVADLVEGLLLAAEKGERLHHDGPPGQGIYFMAGDDHPTYAELGQAMAAALGRKTATVVHVPGPLAHWVGLCGDAMAQIRQRAGWVNSDKIIEALAGSWTCSSAKARIQLGWSPGDALARRLHETALWYRGAGWL
jgi:nucleoside-diphosphate-sugar epimerase